MGREDSFLDLARKMLMRMEKPYVNLQQDTMDELVELA